MRTTICGLAGVLLAAGLTAAQAAPNIPPSEMPGRERQRFHETPIDRFTQPQTQPRDVTPQWRCHQRSTSKHSKRRSNRNRDC
jgi:hypothetical protein